MAHVKDSPPPFPPFALLMPTTTTTNTASNPILLLLPTPLAALSTPYIDLYRSLHADAAFCRMGFGAGFAARSWTRDECADVVRQRDVRPGWMGEGGDLEMGDFAVGLVRDDDLGARLLHGGGGAPVAGRRSVGKEGGIQILEGDAFRRAFGDNITTTTNTTSSQDGEDDDEPFKGVEWVGYAGVRDAKRSMPPRSPSDAPLPPPQELVELRYGVAPSFWGKGIAPRAAEAVMAWAAAEKGVRRFVAETEADNERSGKVLGRMGFRVCATDYWKDEGQLEWERVV